MGGLLADKSLRRCNACRRVREMLVIATCHKDVFWMVVLERSPNVLPKEPPIYITV